MRFKEAKALYDQLKEAFDQLKVDFDQLKEAFDAEQMVKIYTLKPYIFEPSTLIISKQYSFLRSVARNFRISTLARTISKFIIMVHHNYGICKNRLVKTVLKEGNVVSNMYKDGRNSSFFLVR